MLELIKDYVRISNNCLLEDKTDVYEFDCIIPDTLPDMQKVLAVDAHAESDSVSKTSGGINLYFKINILQIMFFFYGHFIHSKKIGNQYVYHIFYLKL